MKNKNCQKEERMKSFANICFLFFSCYICENVMYEFRCSLTFCSKNQKVGKCGIVRFSQIPVAFGYDF